jgi:putative phage-type endonuclease
MMEQRTDDWFAARLGKVTASRIGDVMARTKTGYAASRANYMAQIVVERLTNKKEESYTNAAMQWGTDTEPLARSAYEVAMNVLVKEVGFIDHPTISMSGASPDGLVDDDGLIEIKCPNTATHIDTLLNETIDSKYQYQMLWQMRCTGRKWCDFVSYDPRMPEELQLKIIRVQYDQSIVDQIENEVKAFLVEVDKKVSKLLEVKNGVR